MQKLKLAAVVTSASAVSLELKLDGDEFSLKRNGDEWKGEREFSVGETLAVVFGVVGIEGTGWKLGIAVVCTDGRTIKMVEAEGTIPGGANGRGRFETKLNVPTAPCAAKTSGGN